MKNRFLSIAIIASLLSFNSSFAGGEDSGGGIKKSESTRVRRNTSKWSGTLKLRNLNFLLMGQDSNSTVKVEDLCVKEEISQNSLVSLTTKDSRDIPVFLNERLLACNSLYTQFGFCLGKEIEVMFVNKQDVVTVVSPLIASRPIKQCESSN